MVLSTFLLLYVDLSNCPNNFCSQYGEIHIYCEPESIGSFPVFGKHSPPHPLIRCVVALRSICSLLGGAIGKDKHRPIGWQFKRCHPTPPEIVSGKNSELEIKLNLKKRRKAVNHERRFCRLGKRKQKNCKRGKYIVPCGWWMSLVFPGIFSGLALV